MGGYRNGSGRPAKRLKHEVAKRLEMRYLVRNNYLTGYSKRLNWSVYGETTGNIMVTPRSDEIHLNYGIKTNEQFEDCSQTVCLIKEGCRFGGHRYWFVCPRCKSKRATLYFRRKHFACRVCQGISYEVQSGGYEDRICHNFHKLEETIINKSKWGTRSFKHLMEKMEMVSEQYNSVLESAIGRLMSTSGVVAT
jgi:hypothetical protein